MMNTMMRLASVGCFLLVLTIGGEARATEPIRIQIRFETASSNGELARLMRNNSMRIALQRHRRWQAAVRHEEKRSQARKIYRKRKMHRKGGMGRLKSRDVAPSSMATKSGADRTPALRKGSGRASAGATERRRTAARQAAKVPDLRQLLRRGRVGSSSDLERRLRARIREQRRQAERLRSRGRHGAPMAPRRPGRSGR